MEIKEIREEIDSIDKELVALFLRRMDCSAKVAKYKRENGLPILDPKREEELLKRISAQAGAEFEQYAKKLYFTILELSREYQQKLNS